MGCTGGEGGAQGAQFMPSHRRTRLRALLHIFGGINRLFKSYEEKFDTNFKASIETIYKVELPLTQVQ